MLHKILNWDQHSSDQLHIYGTTLEQWSYVLHSFLQNQNHHLFNKSHLIITSSNEEAEDLYQSLEQYCGKEMRIIFYPGLDGSPYSGVISSEKGFYDRFDVLSRLAHKNEKENKFFLLTSFEALALKLPPPEFLGKIHFL